MNHQASGPLFDPSRLTIDELRFRSSGTDLIFEEAQEKTSRDHAAQITILKTDDGGLALDDGERDVQQYRDRNGWQSVWTITTNADYQGRSLLIIMMSGSSQIAGPWLQASQQFLHGLPKIELRIADDVTQALLDKNKSLLFLINDLHTGLSPAHWAALLPHLPATQSASDADTTGALKISSVTFATPDAPQQFASAGQDTVTVDLRFLCPATQVPDIAGDDGFLTFGDWIDITGQVVAIRANYDGTIKGLQIER